MLQGDNMELRTHMKAFHLQLPLEIVALLRKSKTRKRCATDAEAIRRILDEYLRNEKGLSSRKPPAPQAGNHAGEQPATTGVTEGIVEES